MGYHRICNQPLYLDICIKGQWLDVTNQQTAWFFKFDIDTWLYLPSQSISDKAVLYDIYG